MTPSNMSKEQVLRLAFGESLSFPDGVQRTYIYIAMISFANQETKHFQQRIKELEAEREKDMIEFATWVTFNPPRETIEQALKFFKASQTDIIK
jgi:hypothetical protein